LLWVEDAKRVFGQIPIACAVEEERLLSILQSWGIHSLADFARLPQQAIAERLGKPGLALWRSLNHASPRLLRLEQPTPEFKASMELEFEIESLEPLHFVLERLLDQLTLELGRALLKAQILHLQLDLSQHTHYRKAFKLPEPTRNPSKLRQVLHAHLENLQTRDSIVAVTLEVIPTDAADPQSHLFQQQVRDPWQFSNTLHQLVGLVGSENVGTPVLKDSHEPDAFTLQALGTTLEALPNPLPDTLRPATQLKLQRFRPPLPVQVHGSQGQPSHILASPPTRTELSGKILGFRGPWHLSGMWWDQRHWQRLEWDVQLESGPLLRLLYTRNQWFLEGAYG
jgi:protein ImuB